MEVNTHEHERLVTLIVVPCILYGFINYYQQMHYIAIKITQITVFYVIIRATTCFDPPGSSSGSSEGPSELPEDDPGASKYVVARIIT